MDLAIRRGGAKRDRTANLLVANQALSQLSYSPIAPLVSCIPIVGLSGVEPLTSRLSGVRSNQLSYRPRDKKMCAQRKPKVIKCCFFLS